MEYFGRDDSEFPIWEVIYIEGDANEGRPERSRYPKKGEDSRTKFPFYPVTAIYISNWRQENFFVGCRVEPEEES